MKSYKIHLIRHGQTEANEKGLYIGRTDLPLSPAGLAELLALRAEMDIPAPPASSPVHSPDAGKRWRFYIPAADRK